MPKYRNNKNISTMPLPSPRGTRGLSPGALPGIPKGFTRDIPPASFPRIPKNFDDAAFDAMTKATESDASNLFTESVYNTTSNNKERKAYDTKAHDILRRMYDADSAKNKFKDIDFNKYLDLLKPSLFEERILSRGMDQKTRSFFQDIYEGDFDQFRASAMKAPMEKQTTWRDKDLRMGPGPEESPTLREAMLHKGGVEESRKIESGIDKFPELFKDYKKY